MTETSPPAHLRLSPTRTRYIIWTLLSLMTLIGTAIDLIAPSLPAMVNSLQVSNNAIKNAIAIYLLGYALGSFIAGFLADAYGRLKPLRIGLIGFIIASFIPVIFSNLTAMLIARFLQGLLISAGVIGARTIFADILPLQRLIHMGTWFATMWALGPIVGPVLGGYLQEYFGWKSGFYFFAIAAMLILILVLILIPETHLNKQSLQFRVIASNIKTVISNRLFLGLILLMGLLYSPIVIFCAAGPFLIQVIFHHSAIFFGHLAFWLGIAFLIATIIARYLMKHCSLKSIFTILFSAALVLSLISIIASYIFNTSMLLIIAASAVMYFCSGFVSLCMGRGISMFNAIAGAASAVMFLLNMLLTSVTGFVINQMTVHTITALVILYFAILCLCALIYWTMVRQEI